MIRSVLVFALLGAIAAAQDTDPLVVESAKWGAAMRRPSDSWKVVEGGGEEKLTLHRDGFGGAVAASLEFRWHVSGDTAREIAAKEVARYREARTVKRVAAAEAKFGKAAAPGLDALVESAGVVYRVRRRYAVRDGVAYVFQDHAPEDGFGDHEGALDASAGSVVFTPLPEEELRKRRVVGLASRCGSRIAWARSWEEAATRARAEGKLVLAFVSANGGFEIGGLTRSEVFMHREIAALLETRFVPIEYDVGLGAPFEAPDVYGLSGTTFGRTILCANPAGEVVAETSTIHPHWVDAFLVAVAAEHAPAAERPLTARRAPAASKAFASGESGRALEILDRDGSAESHLLRARIHLRDRATRSCREALAAAEKAGAGAVDLGLEWCRLLLCSGDAAAARRLMERLAEQAADERGTEIAFWLARARYESEDHDAAKEAFLSCLEDAENPFAWRAAAWLVALGADLDGTALSRWPTAAVERALAPPVPRSLPAAKVERVRADAVEALLACQRPDGSFISFEAYSTNTLETPGDLSQAIDALAILALWPHRDRSDVRDAVERGLDRLAAVQRLMDAKPRQIVFMDYSVWRHPAWIWALSTIIRDEPERAGKLRPLIESAVADLAKRQKPAGGFGYYVSRQAGRGSSDMAMSFVTAFVAFAVSEAERAGVAVPDRMKRRALDFLLALRHDNDAFEYMTAAARAATPAIGGAAGRGPVCALGLLRHGRAEPGDVEVMLDHFVEHSEGLAAERHKGLMHTGRDTQGSHYLLFDYLTAALAAAELEESDRARYHSVILERVLETRLEGGALLDNPIVGRAAGTAMGLLALDLVAP